MISLGLANEGTQERWHDGTEARAGASEGPSGPTHEPAQGGLSGWDANPYLFDNPAISINDSAPDRRATALPSNDAGPHPPLPCLESFRADAPAPHHHDLGRAGRLGPVPGRA